TGPIKLLFYQNIRGSWVLQKTEYARWSGYTDTVTKYLADVTVPYEGTWRIGASYGGNEIYLSSYGYRDMTVNARNTSGVTRIVVDKSDFRLYLLRNDDLIVSYPVATGRPSMETPARMWKVGAKYYTDPASVYGPRKMRLYRKTSSGYEYTTYLIHGTNEPWVIGTKASHGCVRMYNADVLTLFPQVPLGALVETRE
ncbi:MAG: L,D-transpeptidase, partial [Coriobacteriia bacterium]|nr:L,D-transpeptidase [Coriobacteriia bacterium]